MVTWVARSTALRVIVASLIGLGLTPCVLASIQPELPGDSEFLSAFVSRLSEQDGEGKTVLWLDFNGRVDTDGDGDVLNDANVFLFTDDAHLAATLQTLTLGERLDVMALLDPNVTQQTGRLSYRIVSLEEQRFR